VLIAAGLLKPLGHPPPSGSNYCALAELEKLRSDTRWLARTPNAKLSHWRRRNAGRSLRKPSLTNTILENIRTKGIVP
jgi:hypothetical protein